MKKHGISFTFKTSKAKSETHVFLKGANLLQAGIQILE